LNQWLKIKNNYGLNAALKYFPNDFPRSGFTFILYGIEDQKLKQGADQWRIKSAEDVYKVLTDKEALEKVMQQGLKEEHKQYKAKIIEFFVNMKDRIKVEDMRVY
jgi:hypothetical protein